MRTVKIGYFIFSIEPDLLQRVLPIGSDRKGNDYYLFDGTFLWLSPLFIFLDNRMYIQKPAQPIPKRPKAKSRKSKVASAASPGYEGGESLDDTWEPVSYYFFSCI